MSTGRLGAGDTAIQPTILNAKADLLTATAADTPARLAVGANDTVLTADSAEATGLKWAAPAAGGKVAQVVSDNYNCSISQFYKYDDITGLSLVLHQLSNFKDISFSYCSSSG
jgi:phage portal protein BeeE